MAKFKSIAARMKLYQLTTLLWVSALGISWLIGCLEEGIIATTTLLFSLLPMTLTYGFIPHSKFIKMEQRFSGFKFFLYPPGLLVPSYLLAEYLIPKLGILG